MKFLLSHLETEFVDYYLRLLKLNKNLFGLTTHSELDGGLDFDWAVLREDLNKQIRSQDPNCGHKLTRFWLEIKTK